MGSVQFFACPFVVKLLTCALLSSWAITCGAFDGDDEVESLPSMLAFHGGSSLLRSGDEDIDAPTTSSGISLPSNRKRAQGDISAMRKPTEDHVDEQDVLEDLHGVAPPLPL
jgi:hypothetical protein